MFPQCDDDDSVIKKDKINVKVNAVTVEVHAVEVIIKQCK